MTAKEAREIWKEIDGWPHYDISNFGNVRTWKLMGSKGKTFRDVPLLLKPAPNSKGYLNVRLGNNGLSKTLTVARLVASAFIGKHPDPKITVDHINNVKTDNRAENLQYLSVKENTLKGTCPPAMNARKTHCPQGHPLEHPNLIQHLLPHRHCKICKSERNKITNARRKRTV